MIESHINIFDGIVIGIIALSGLIAFFRGLVRELLSLFAWIGAVIITIYCFPSSVDFVKNHLGKGESHETVAAGVAALGTFVLSLILLSVLSAIITRYVKTSAEVGLLDNMLGLLFGVARGIFVVALGYLMLSVTLPDDRADYPQWLKGSKTEPWAAEAAETLREAAPKYIADMQRDAKSVRDKAAEHRAKMQDRSDHISFPATLEPTHEPKREVNP